MALLVSIHLSNVLNVSLVAILHFLAQLLVHFVRQVQRIRVMGALPFQHVASALEELSGVWLVLHRVSFALRDTTLIVLHLHLASCVLLIRIVVVGMGMVALVSSVASAVQPFPLALLVLRSAHFQAVLLSISQQVSLHPQVYRIVCPFNVNHPFFWLGMGPLVNLVMPIVVMM